MRFADFEKVGSLLADIPVSRDRIEPGLDTSLAEGSPAASVREMYKNGEIDEKQYVELMESLGSYADSQTTAL